MLQLQPSQGGQTGCEAILTLALLPLATCPEGMLGDLLPSQENGSDTKTGGEENHFSMRKSSSLPF